MTVCLIALGSNLNASDTLFCSALHELEVHGAATLALSHVISTRPVGSAAGSLFLNAAATVTSDLSPHELLHSLHHVESVFGRTRTVHWGPRTLDLDLLLFGDTIIDEPHLVVPHPAMWYRRFVLEPANQVASTMRHPILKCTIGDLYRSLLSRPLILSLHNARQCLQPDVSQLESEAGTHFDLHSLTERLNADNSGLRWISGSESPHGFETSFARVILQHPAGLPTFRTQPRNMEDRTIEVVAESPEQAYSELLHLATAMTG